MLSITCGGNWGGRWDLNPRHSEPQSDALPAELLPPYSGTAYYRTASRREGSNTWNAVPRLVQWLNHCGVAGTADFVD